jgi:hypothetical protein
LLCAGRSIAQVRRIAPPVRLVFRARKTKHNSVSGERLPETAVMVRDFPAESHDRRSICEGSMTFRVGQKVVCVRGWGGGDMSVSVARSMGYTHPAIREVVTIKTLNAWSHATLLTFHEHDNSHIQKQLNSRYEPGFDARAFRPIVERKTDISIFTRMLNPSKVKANA